MLFSYNIWLILKFYNLSSFLIELKISIFIKFLIQILTKIENLRILTFLILMNRKTENNINNLSSLLVSSKSSEKRVLVTSKRKLIISPSKDLLIFFDDSNLTSLGLVKKDKVQKKNAKLTLNRKQVAKQQNTKQKCSEQRCEKLQKIHSITNSTDSSSSKKCQNTQNQKFLKLKKEVDQIRRKYSYGKLRQSTNLNRINSADGLRASNSNQNSRCSLNSSKQKTPFLTPKNDKCLSKKILTRNIFFSNSRRLRLTESKAQDKTKYNNQFNQFLEQRRKTSFQIHNLSNSIDLTQQLNNKQPFQFTFGSMALMDFNSKSNKILLK